MYVVDYDCITGAGYGRANLMKVLYEGRVCSHLVQTSEWSTTVPAGGLVATLPEAVRTPGQFKSEILKNLMTLWAPFQKSFDRQELSQKRVGLVFSTTKGSVEDYIWDDTVLKDPYIEILTEFSEAANLLFQKTVTLSNACSSSHVALEYIQDLFDTDQLDYAFFIAADLVGPFVYSGFHSLKVLSHTRNLPFSAARDGLQLGEAVTLALLSKEKGNSSLKISAVASDTEGSSITRPSVKGQGLIRTLQKIEKKSKKLTPDLIVAHGTGTRFNDQAEDQALSEFFKTPVGPVTNTKWSIGHTLGASGSVDLISACEVLKNQKAFPIQHGGEKDPRFQMNYLMGPDSLNGTFHQILITSLGFGGVHASLVLDWEPL